MDNTIRIITDSGCDISKENEEKYKGLLEIMPFMVTIQGKSYVDRQDIQAEEFYKVLKEQQEIPKHSQITAIQFEDKYRELYAQGVRTIIVDVINGAGSQTCSNAQLAKQNVADELKDLTVYVVDSQNSPSPTATPLSRHARSWKQVRAQRASFPTSKTGRATPRRSSWDSTSGT